MKIPKIIAVIPARMGSSRFPGKPLAPILGKPMIEHVYRNTAACPELTDIYVATCDQEIADAVESFGGTAIMTSPKHERASDRVAEAIENLEADIVVMVQGDEPMITPVMISQALEPMLKDPDIVCVNLAKRIESQEEFEDRNTIKLVMDNSQNALYFSREPIPTRHLQSFTNLPVYKQVCVIPFRRSFLKTYTELAPTPLEQAESIDMLRCLEHGWPVRLVVTHGISQAVDTPADLKRVEALMQAEP